jgi:hypothetical protein
MIRDTFKDTDEIVWDVSGSNRIGNLFQFCGAWALDSDFGTSTVFPGSQRGRTRSHGPSVTSYSCMTTLGRNFPFSHPQVRIYHQYHLVRYMHHTPILRIAAIDPSGQHLLLTVVTTAAAVIVIIVAVIVIVPCCCCSFDYSGVAAVVVAVARMKAPLPPESSILPKKYVTYEGGGGEESTCEKCFGGITVPYNTHFCACCCSIVLYRSMYYLF